MRQRYPHREWVLQHLPSTRDPWDLLDKMLGGRPWLAERLRHRDQTLLDEYRGDIIVAALCAARGDMAGQATAMLEALGQSSNGLGHVIDALALSDCAAPARDFLDRVWPVVEGAFIDVKPSIPGLLEHYIRSRGPMEAERMAANLDRRSIHTIPVEPLASLRVDAIPALARVAGLAGYSKGVLDVVDRILGEIVWATLSCPSLREDGLKCLKAAEFTRKVFTEPVEQVLRSPGFDCRDWAAQVRRHPLQRWDSPAPLCFRQALHLCCMWEIMPPRERLSALKDLQGRIGRLLTWAKQVHDRETADVYLTAQHLVVEPRMKWFIKQPAAPVAVARLTQEVQRELYQLKHFLRYICQARICGMLKDFARETLSLLPD
jgi:hypothetical protein